LGSFFQFGKIALVVSLMGIAPACSKQAVLEKSVESAIIANNETVNVLDALQSSLRNRRQAVMEHIAKTVNSKEEGIRELDAVDERYKPLVKAFLNIETAQEQLANGLELAKSSVLAGNNPNIEHLLLLYSQIQQMYNGIMSAMAKLD